MPTRDRPLPHPGDGRGARLHGDLPRRAAARSAAPCSLKTLKPTVSADSPFAAELEREAAVLGRLDHEGIVRLHDFVRVHAPEPLYLVLEDARAVPLDEVLRASVALDPEVAAAVALGRRERARARARARRGPPRAAHLGAVAHRAARAG